MREFKYNDFEFINPPIKMDEYTLITKATYK